MPPPTGYGRFSAGVDGLGEIRLESQPDGTVSGQCHAAGEDLRQVSRAIFFAFAGAGEALLELSLSRASLEDIFLELTGKAASL